MPDHVEALAAIPPERRARLTRRRNAPGLWHLAGHLGLLALTGTWVMTGAPGWALALVAHGVLLVFLFTLSHECTHRTAFRTAWLNDWVGHAIAPLLCLPFLWFRYFHLAHHRWTNDPDRDPEIAGHPRPDSWPSMLLYLSGWSYWRGGTGVLLSHAAGRFSPLMPERRRAALRREARLVLLVQAALLGSLALTPAGFWLWILPALIGQPVLRLYLLAEHGLCPPVANMLENSRTTFTNRAVRWLAWNMPYHAEHHSAPEVPFHQLPALHRELAEHLRSTSPGYVAFHRDYARRLSN